MQSTIPVTYSTKLETGSPVGGSAMLSPIHPSYQAHSPQPGYHPQSATSTSSGRMSWDGFNGYSRIGGDGGASDDSEPKARYELAPADLGGRDAYGPSSASAATTAPSSSSMPRIQESAASLVSSLPFGAYDARDADGRFSLSYSDPQRWYYTNQQAVG